MTARKKKPKARKAKITNDDISFFLKELAHAIVELREAVEDLEHESRRNGGAIQRALDSTFHAKAFRALVEAERDEYKKRLEDSTLPFNRGVRGKSAGG